MQHRSRSRAHDASGRSSLLRALLVLVAVSVLPCLQVLVPSGTVHADTMTGSSTTGTASTVSPSTVAVGGTLTYTLSGFPQGATVQVLVDDGALTAQDPVVTEVGVGGDGTTSGRIELPGYVDEGVHWLRFRVSSGQDVPTSQVRTTDYTNKSPYFTVAGVTVIGGGRSVPAGDGPPASPALTAPAAAPAAPDASPAALAAGEGPGAGLERDEPPSHGFPLVGASFLGLAVVMVVLAGVVVRNRRRLAEHERLLAERT